MKKYLIPAAIFLCFVGLYLGYSNIKNSNYIFLPVWDIRHYIDISEIGYQVYPCTPGVEYPAGKICGNAGWYPFWPIVAKLIRPLTGDSSQITFIGLAFLFTLLSFLMVFRFMEKNFGLKEAVISTLALAFSPGSFYFLTGFPYALFIFLFILYLFLLYRPPDLNRDIGLFAVAVAISLTYPSGILLALIPFIWNIISKHREKVSFCTPGYWLSMAKYIIPFILGLLLLWSYFHFKFDDFFLQLHFQAKYQRTWAVPFWIIFKSLTQYPIFSPENAVILWYGLTFLLFIPYKIRTELWVAALVLYLFSPATGTTMSIYRHYLILLPCYMIIGASPRPRWFKLAFVLAGLVLAITVLFPLFISNRLI